MVTGSASSDAHRRRFWQAVKFVAIIAILVVVAVVDGGLRRGESYASIAATAILTVVVFAAIGLAGPALIWLVAKRSGRRE